MNRHWVSRAVVLSRYPITDLHRGIWLVTEDRGVVCAIAHGAAKGSSRLGASTQLFSLGHGEFYEVASKDQLTLKGFNRSTSLLGHGVDPLNLALCSTAAEILIGYRGDLSTGAVGSFDSIVSFFEGFGGQSPEKNKWRSARFFWLFMAEQGLGPDFPLTRHPFYRYSSTDGVFYPSLEADEGRAVAYQGLKGLQAAVQGFDPHEYDPWVDSLLLWLVQLWQSLVGRPLSCLKTLASYL